MRFKMKRGQLRNINPLEIGISNPPTQGEVEAIYDKLNELMSLLMRN